MHTVAQDAVNVLALASVYFIFALGLSLSWGSVGILNFAHGAVYAFGAFVAYLVTQHLRAPIFLLLPVGMVVGAMMTVLIQTVVYQQIAKRSTDARTGEMRVLIGGLGAGGIVVAIAEHVTHNVPYGLTNSSFHVRTYHLAGVLLSNIQIIMVSAAAILGIGIAVWLRRSRTGLALRAIGTDAEVASMMGIDRQSMARLAMVLGGALAGLAGVLLTYYLGAMAPESGDTLLIKAFAVIVLGGLGSVAGAMLGALLLGIAETVVLTQTSGLWVNAISFGLIFVGLLVRPQGIFGRSEVRRT